MTSTSGAETATEIGGYKDRLWYFRFWNGINAGGWYRLLWRNRFAVAPRCVAMALIISAISIINSLLGAVQALLFGRKVARTRIEEPPIFIIGHWRSGTTLLHELLVLDERYSYPDTYCCYSPNHFLISSWCIPWLFGFLLPSRRPMDNMAAGWKRPQEDEFALCNMGVPSPYLTIAFSNRPPQYEEYLDLQDVPPEDLARWKGALLWFLKCVTLRNPKRLVLKSPPHTARIRVLLELFPDARFVHVVRDPCVIFPSTINLWRRHYRDQGLQVPKYEGLEDHVFRTFNRMYDAFQRDRELIDPGRFAEVSYEELVADPVGQMRKIYESLDLGEFDKVLPAIEEHLAEVADYKPNRYQISPEQRAEITRRWGAYIEKYGYSSEATDARGSPGN